MLLLLPSPLLLAIFTESFWSRNGLSNVLVVTNDHTVFRRMIRHGAAEPHTECRVSGLFPVLLFCYEPTCLIFYYHFSVLLFLLWVYFPETSSYRQNHKCKEMDGPVTLAQGCQHFPFFSVQGIRPWRPRPQLSYQEKRLPQYLHVQPCKANLETPGKNENKTPTPKNKATKTTQKKLQDIHSKEHITITRKGGCTDRNNTGRCIMQSKISSQFYTDFLFVFQTCKSNNKRIYATKIDWGRRDGLSLPPIAYHDTTVFGQVIPGPRSDPRKRRTNAV